MAVNGIGESKSWSQEAEPGRVPADFPGQCVPPTSAWQWPTSIELSWFHPKTNGSPIDAYAIRYSKLQDMQDSIEVGPGTMEAAVESCSTAVGDLSEMQTYYFQIRAKNEVGWGEWSIVSNGFVTKASRPARPLKPET